MNFFPKIIHFCAWAIFLPSLFSASFAQQYIKEKSVPPAVLQDFAQRFQDAEDIAWYQQGEELYAARFFVLETKTEALFMPDGQWMQTQEDIPYSSMPDSARKFCSIHFADFSFKQAIRLSTRKYGILYDLYISNDLKTKILTFDMKGKMIEENEELNPKAETEGDGKKPGLLGKVFKPEG